MNPTGKHRPKRRHHGDEAARHFARIRAELEAASAETGDEKAARYGAIARQNAGVE